MKHEFVNTIIACLGLGLAGFTTANQFWPKNDAISLIVEGRVEAGANFQIDAIGTIDPTTGEHQPVVGPIIWKIRVHNPTDHAVSLVSFEAYLIPDSGSRIEYSRMRERLSPFDASLPNQDLPENIPPYESRAYLVSLFAPFTADQDTQDRCEDSVESLSALELCFFEKGRDLFGNSVQVVESESELFVARWTDEFNGPRFNLVLETADGSEFNAILSFHPGL